MFRHLSLKRSAYSGITVCMLLFASLSSAQVQVNVSRTNIMHNETLTITFVASGQGFAPPNWSVLEKDFQILDTQQSNIIKSINGNTQSQTTWKLELAPKRTGRLHIPSLPFGSMRSKPQVIQVKQASTPKKQPQQRPIYIEVKATPLNPYVQQEVKYVLKIFMGKNLRGNISPLSFSANVLSEGLPERRYRVNQHGRNYEVYERTYMLYPQKSGKVVIKPVDLNGHYIERNRRFTVREKSTPIHLNVRPMPAAFSGSVWLPSARIELTEKWSSDPNEWQQGQALTRTIKMVGHNLLAQQLPKVETVNNPAFNVYAETNLSLNTQKNPQGFKGVSKQKFVFIPTQTGEQEIPAVEIPWWNTQKERQEVARLPARKVNIQASTGISQQSMLNSLPPDQITASQDMLAQQDNESSTWVATSIVLFIAWLVTLGFALQAWVRDKLGAIKLQRSHRALLKRVYRKIQQASRAHDAKAMRIALMQWGRLFWQHNPPQTLVELKRRCTPGLRQRLDAFDHVIYTQAGGSWDGESLYQAVIHEPPPATVKPTKSSMHGLEPMYKA